MTDQLNTCPKCGALVTPQTTRCRQCEAYLNGSRADGWLARLLPATSLQFPGVAALLTTILIYWVLLIASTDLLTVLSAQTFSLRQFGAMHPPLIILGQYWRFVTSVLAHHDLLHLLMNCWALVVSGRVVERIYGARKLVSVFWASGVLSMVGSFVWNTFLRDGGFVVTSSGASGAVCGLIGAALVGVHRIGNKDASQALWRWVFYIAAFGLIVPSIDNAAHGVGFIAGVAFAWPLSQAGRRAESAASSIVWNVMTVAIMLAVIASTGTAFMHGISGPTTLSRDIQGRSILMFTLQEGVTPEGSTQARLGRVCDRAVYVHDDIDGLVEACRSSALAYPYNPSTWEVLGAAEAARGNEEAAGRLERVAERVALAIQPES